jgi:hypothetical protein
MSFTPIVLPVKFPLLSMPTCAALTGESVTELTLSAEAGYLRLVFNISPPGSTSRALRVMTSSLAEYIRDGRKLRTETPAQVLAEISAIFPALSPDVSTENVTRLFACSRHHVENLRDAACIKLTRKGRFGRGGSARYCRHSLIAFLQKRRLA